MPKTMPKKQRSNRSECWFCKVSVKLLGVVIYRETQGNLLHCKYLDWGEDTCVFSTCVKGKDGERILRYLPLHADSVIVCL